MELILMTYTDLFPHLVTNRMVEPIVSKHLISLFLEWYNPDDHCEYRDGMPGHSIEDCIPFKDEVQKLIQSGVLSFAVEEQLIDEPIEEDIVANISTT